MAAAPVAGFHDALHRAARGDAAGDFRADSHPGLAGIAPGTGTWPRQTRADWNGAVDVAVHRSGSAFQSQRRAIAFAASAGRMDRDGAAPADAGRADASLVSAGRGGVPDR